MGKVTYDFTGQIALVTGGAAGIGLVTARAFARSGAKVAVADIDGAAIERAVAGIRDGGGDAIGIVCDVADEAAVAAMVDETVSAFGRLDFAFNNAGIIYSAIDATMMDGAHYDRVMGINLKGVWNSMRHELIRMRAQGSGAIVNCSSIAGVIGSAGRCDYSAAKHGVLGMTKSVALEVAREGIRVNAVCPGTIVTPMTDRMADLNDLDMEAVRASVPIGRTGEADDIAHAVLWLCSDASTYVIGHALTVDGGHTIQ